ncbi:hypothetical protein G5714_022083 [Onychostoma macrolepis]|uniref:Uncharacterized protein n=1 Tax=Onychostoma macrolepis TaxID=369639 RepID=A0A7J6BUU2_9TELE|nr:hypothetical protein G5714_022083 [Onychostoma macrolepis]
MFKVEEFPPRREDTVSSKSSGAAAPSKRETGITSFQQIKDVDAERKCAGDGGVPVPRIQVVEDKETWTDADEENTLGDGGVPVPRIQDVEDKEMWTDADEENTLGKTQEVSIGVNTF